jgi:hypothetical protein
MHQPSRNPLLFAALAALLLASACKDDERGPSNPDAARLDIDAAGVGIDGGPGAGIDGGPGAGIDGGAGAVSGIAVVGSDYTSSSVSLLDRQGNLVADGCLHSGTGAPGLAATLSGDVVLPTQASAGGPLVIVDRTNAALTFVEPSTCAVLGQLAVSTGFKSNPQDFVALSATKAYVVRQDPNPVPTPALADFDEGNDLLIVNPSTSTITGRIDLAPYAPAGVLPRGHRALLAGNKVFVSLNAVSEDYSTYGAGRVVVVDPAVDQVVGVVDLPAAKNCGAMAYVASPPRLLVACAGAYGDPAGQAATSAVVAIDLTQPVPWVSAQVPASTLGTAPFSNTTIAAIDASSVLAVAVGDFTGSPPDSLWFLPLDGRSATKVFESSEGFALGAIAVDPERHVAFASDGTMMSPAFLRTFDFSTGAFVPAKTVKTNPTQKLPPRSLLIF